MKNLFIALAAFLVFSCTTQGDTTITFATLSGSYATMLPINGFLYVIDDENISTFDISDEQDPILVNEQEVGFSIESLYHHEGVLFIGSAEALHIFTINEEGIPVRNSLTEYNFDQQDDWAPCDPVVADDKYAYVTLRTSIDISTGWCFNRFADINELRIYNIEDLSTPELLSITDMDNPRGLGILGNNLFVCEGNLGVKLFDVTNREEPVMVWEDLGFEAFDLILRGDIMIVVGATSLRQYDISDLEDIQYLTEIVI